MITTRVKPYDLGEMSVKWIEKKGNFESLAIFENPEELKAEAIETIKNKGMVFGVFDKKDLVGIFIFKKQDNYFENKNEFIELGAKKIDLQKFWFGDSTSAFVLTKKYLPEMPGETEDKLGKHITDTLYGYISGGTIAGVVYEDMLYYRKNISDKRTTRKVMAGYVVGFLLGMGIGIAIFHKWWMGFCFGASYMMLFGGAGVALQHKNAEGTFDLNSSSTINEEEKEEK